MVLAPNNICQERLMHASGVDALRCAVEVQRGMAERNAEVPQDKRIEFRVGIHQGDIIIDGGDIFGDGVNVAARLEGLAEPGSICVSGRVQENAEGKLVIPRSGTIWR
jgi:class 3 adenylate cyclase